MTTIAPDRSQTPPPLGRLAVPAVVAALAAALAACGPPAEDQPEPAPEVMVFAAASLRDAALEIGPLFAQETGTDVRYNFAGSNDLAQQILAAPKADVFLSANEGWMDEVEAAGRLAPGTRSAFLSNRLVVVARADSPHRVSAPEDLATLPYRHLALANPEAVPAGIYARQWLASRPGPGGGSLWDAVAPRVAPAPDVRAALALAESDPEVIGIVYQTDAAASERAEVLYQVPADQAPPIRYAAAAIAGGPNPQGGRAYVEFLAGEAASAVFRRHGFVVGEGAPAAAEGGDVEPAPAADAGAEGGGATAGAESGNG